ncbi:hypothetical protein SAMN04488054_102282 [Salibacterium qingdaonense]|uniref:Uncharacterized protein n=1 Tax=Salibacterium qingdaonense TaxID=266892 RepID=A0A1I4IX93_9BACI|nr:hypothetical protein SAMN04488054_102282 [Salibacterium qingdaonense]
MRIRSTFQHFFGTAAEENKYCPNSFRGSYAMGAFFMQAEKDGCLTKLVKRRRNVYHKMTHFEAEPIYNKQYFSCS